MPADCNVLGLSNGRHSCAVVVLDGTVGGLCVLQDLWIELVTSDFHSDQDSHRGIPQV